MSLLQRSCLMLALASAGASAMYTGTASAASFTPDAGAAMPISVYKKLKTHFDQLYGSQVAPLLPGVMPVDREAVEKALRADAAANLAAIVRALNAPDGAQRDLAVRSLEYSGDNKTAVGALKTTVLADPEENIRTNAAAILGRIPDANSVDALLGALNDSSDRVRGAGAVALGNIRDPRATEPLLRILMGDSKTRNRLQAAFALSKIKDPKSKDGLTQALSSEADEKVKLAIGAALQNLEEAGARGAGAPASGAQAAEELKKLADEMKSVEQKLRSDRHDASVQTQGGDIEKRLASLIEQLDKQCNNCNSNSQRKSSSNSNRVRRMAPRAPTRCSRAGWARARKGRPAAR